MTDKSFLSLKASQLSANRLAYELCAAVRAGNGVNFFQRFDREADENRLNLHWGAAHENNLPVSDIAY